MTEEGGYIAFGEEAINFLLQIKKEVTMPEDDKFTLPEEIQENIGMSDYHEPLEELDKAASQLEKNNETLINLTKRIDQLADLFKFPLGCKVRNRHNEDGYIEMCAIDYRGLLYLVNLPGNKSRWYTEFEIKKINFDPDNKEQTKLKDKLVQTDIPDPALKG